MRGKSFSPLLTRYTRVPLREGAFLIKMSACGAHFDKKRLFCIFACLDALELLRCLYKYDREDVIALAVFRHAYASEVEARVK